MPKIDPALAKFRLSLKTSKIHRWGVYAAEPIPKGKQVIEYIGERISRRETKRRAETAEFNYLFTVDTYWTLDGSVNGSGAEFINHSCEPNIAARVIKGRIYYFTKRDIRDGEELTIDYHFPKEDETVKCACGTTSCRGTINLK